MKKLMTVIAWTAVVMVSRGQGSVTFGNFNPVTLADGKTLLNSAYAVELYAGPTALSLAAIPESITPFLELAPGYFFDPSPVVIPGVPAGGTAIAVVKAWRLADGATFEAAASTVNSQSGQSLEFTIVGLGGSLVAGLPPVPPANLNMPGFSIALAIPEPSTSVCLLLGTGIVLLRERRSTVGRLAAPLVGGPASK